MPQKKTEQIFKNVTWSKGMGPHQSLTIIYETGRLTIFYFAVLAKPLGPWKINGIGGMPSMFIRFCLFHVNNFNLKAHFARHCIPTKYWVFLLHFRESWKHCLYIQLPWGSFSKKASMFVCSFTNSFWNSLWKIWLQHPLCQNTGNLLENHIVPNKSNFWMQF